MKEAKLKVKLEQPSLTGRELQQMALGVLIYRGVIAPDESPEHTIFIDVIPDEDDDTFPEFIVRVCESAEEEEEIRRLENLIGSDDFGFDGTARHFEMKRKPE